MKSLLVVFSLIVISGMGAKASAQQTTECGDNVKQVQNIIDQHDDWDLAPNHTKKFLGAWGEGGKLKIENHGNFSFGDYTFQACPQQDGSFYIKSKNPTGYFGYLKMKFNKVVVTGFTGLAASFNDAYAKASGNAVANGGRNY